MEDVGWTGLPDSGSYRMNAIEIDGRPAYGSGPSGLGSMVPTGYIPIRQPCLCRLQQMQANEAGSPGDEESRR